jgi:hypothetical protein
VWRERQKGRSSFKIFKLIPSYLKLYLGTVIDRFSLKLKQDKKSEDFSYRRLWLCVILMFMVRGNL